MGIQYVLYMYARGISRKRISIRTLPNTGSAEELVSHCRMSVAPKLCKSGIVYAFEID